MTAKPRMRLAVIWLVLMSPAIFVLSLLVALFGGTERDDEHDPCNE